jgi:hypothetical protein
MSTPRDQRTLVHDLRAPPGPASADLADVLAQAVKLGFGLASLGLGVALRTLAEPPATVPRNRGMRMPVSDFADVLVGTAWGAARLSGRLAATGARIAAPVLGLALRPPLVPRRLQPGYRVQLMTERWRRDRPETVRALGRWSATALPGALDATLAQVDLERVVTVVLDRVDLNVLVADVVRRLDLDALVVAVLERLDLDSLVQTSLNRLDLNPIVSTVITRADIDAIATTALAQIHLELVVSAALDQLDLTQLVLDRVDLERVVSAALQGIDLTQIVLQQVDLLGVAEYVVEGIDLPEIIRDSTGSVASEAVRGLRMQGVDADVAVGRVVDRMLRRRRHRRTEKAPEQLSSPDALDDPLAGKPV